MDLDFTDELNCFFKFCVSAVIKRVALSQPDTLK